jgi:hypothetical protein
MFTAMHSQMVSDVKSCEAANKVLAYLTLLLLGSGECANENGASLQSKSCLATERIAGGGSTE